MYSKVYRAAEWCAIAYTRVHISQLIGISRFRICNEKDTYDFKTEVEIIRS